MAIPQKTAKASTNLSSLSVKALLLSSVVIFSLAEFSLVTASLLAKEMTPTIPSGSRIAKARKESHSSSPYMSITANLLKELENI